MKCTFYKYIGLESQLLTETDRNGLEYYSPVNFESNDTHFGIVSLGYHMGGIQWTHMII